MRKLGNEMGKKCKYHGKFTSGGTRDIMILFLKKELSNKA